MHTKAVIVFLVLSYVSLSLSEHHHPDIPRKFQKVADTREAESSYWNDGAQETLKQKLETKPNTNNAKNLIFFIGDGMSMQTVAATRVAGYQDENHKLPFEEFPSFGFTKTYCVNRQVPDSAATATAFLTGVKINYGLVSVDANVQRYDCVATQKEEHYVESIAQWAIDAGKSVGFVTTTRITHATPAPLYAHSANRYWETDAEVRKDCDPDVIDDIAEQFVYSKLAQQFKVVLGGGRSYFLDNSVVDEEGQPGLREDGKNLIKEWQEIHDKMGNSKYVWNRDDLMTTNYATTDYLLGLFEGNYMKYDYEAATDPDEPSLSDMVNVAIQILSKDENGFFLFVEGGRIDTAHHDQYARIALEETKAYAESVKLAKKMTNEEDTLIVVSSDHAHTMTINGYPTRGNDIHGIGDYSLEDGRPYTTLSYVNGPSFNKTFDDEGNRLDIDDHDFSNHRYQYYSMIPLNAETHGGDDVGVYANGPWNHLFVGAYEQNALPYIMAYASKIGPYSSAITNSIATSLVILCIAHIVKYFF